MAKPPLPDFNSLMSQIADAPSWLQGVLLGLATFFISEDLTTLAAGLLVAQDALSWPVAFWGCFLGIYLGDGLLYLLGLAVGRPVLKWPLFRKMLTEERVQQGEAWFEKNGIAMVFASRFLPGTRLPTYFAAGLMGAKAKSFMLTAMIACALWTPLLLGLAYWFGQKVLLPFELMQEHPFTTFLTGIVALFLLFSTVNLALSKRRRLHIANQIHRWRHWEFWPIHLFYAPVYAYNVLMALRYRSFHAPLYCNPAIPFSGFIGESKGDILELFKNHPEHLLNSVRFEATITYEQLLVLLNEKNLRFPLVLKPDYGQRGKGISIVEHEDGLRSILNELEGPHMLQEYHPGPHEFGVSYVKPPGREHGFIMGITGKVFPTLEGDGKSSQKELIEKMADAKGRFKLFEPYYTDHILQKGERLPLVRIGNHCLGTRFTDESHLITPALEAAFQRIVSHSPGINIGRFDIRASSIDSFCIQAQFKIMEFNGATSEPAYVYDPSFTLWRAWGVFFSYWRWIWKIGTWNQARSSEVLTWWKLFRFSKEK